MIADVLKNNSALTALHMRGEKWKRDESNKCLQKSNIHMKDNWIGDRGAKMIFEGFKYNNALVTLNLGGAYNLF